MQNQKLSEKCFDGETERPKHNWKWSGNYSQWQCMNCSNLCDIYCLFCMVPIPKSKLPKKALEKLGAQVFWHEKCADKALKEQDEQESKN